MAKQQIHLKIQDEIIYLISPHDILSDEMFSDIVGNKHAQAGLDEKRGVYYVILPLKPMFAFMLRHTLKGYDAKVGGEDANTLKDLADKMPAPRAGLSEDKKRLEIMVPSVKHYRDLMRKVDATPKPQGKFTVPVSRAVELYDAVRLDESKYPPLTFSLAAERLFTEPIPGFDGTLESLRGTPLSVLNVVSSNVQSWKQRKASQKTLVDKLTEHGIADLYQLLFEIPRRYIDKSNPQKVHELEVGQSATIIGTVLSSETFNSGRGLNIEVDLTPKSTQDNTSTPVPNAGGGNSGRNVIRVSFFAGAWMKNKFVDGSEVIVTGKYKPWRNIKQIAGDTIEFIDSASALPVTPIYSQSEKKGVTTQVVMRAVQELMARLGNVELPFYLKALYTEDESREIVGAEDDDALTTYADLIRAVHTPRSLEERERAIKQLAFYELIEMQIVVQARQHELQKGSENRGLAHKVYDGKAFDSARKNLPFELTNSQEEGIKTIAVGMESQNSWQGMLSSDVGTGKTIVSTLSSLIAVDSGYQAALVAPTEILARQLYEGFLQTRETVDEQWRQHIDVVFYTGSMKAKEKKEVLAKIKSGEANVIVSTQALLTGSVEFQDLGFVAVDEQQKFGAEQRSALLTARPDGRQPDILQMTATPIPRSTSQALYGDIDFIALTDKPKGRQPIKTEWMQESPRTVVESHVHTIWNDVKREVAKGNKAFVIAPLVEDSEKVDAVAVESTFERLKHGAFSGIDVGFVHGKMKSEDAKQTMLDFKEGKFDILVASTIVEIGVDVPEATRMVILNAERLGASSLHQIRGRIGRNSLPSTCYLVADETTDDGAERLQSLVDNDSGFEIAKSDMLLRDTGTLFNTSQSGKSEFKFLSVARHGHWVSRATKAAKHVLNQPYGGAAVQATREKFGTADTRVL